MEYTVQPIGFVASSRQEAIDDAWDSVSATIELVSDLSEECLRGLEEFSHAEILFLFDRVPEESVCKGSRHPRGNPDWPKVGILAQRAKDRPNRIGSTIVKVLRVEGSKLQVGGLDAIDGTPVLDIKPVMREFLPREETSQPDWATELMREYW